VSVAIRRRIERRANGRCEYCHLHQDDEFYTFHVEHVIARQHGGTNQSANLCFACRECNFAKGTNVASYWQGRLVPLFNPRRQSWNRHFRWQGPRLIGRTLAGKVTVKILNINERSRVALRAVLITAGRFPPPDDPRI
jgi:HNH endonuclease